MYESICLSLSYLGSIKAVYTEEYETKENN